MIPSSASASVALFLSLLPAAWGQVTPGGLNLAELEHLIGLTTMDMFPSSYSSDSYTQGGYAATGAQPVKVPQTQGNQPTAHTKPVPVTKPVVTTAAHPNTVSSHPNIVSSVSKNSSLPTPSVVSSNNKPPTKSKDKPIPVPPVKPVTVPAAPSKPPTMPATPAKPVTVPAASVQPVTVPASQQNQNQPPPPDLHPQLPSYGSDAPSARSDIDRWLDAHNVVRQKYTVANLTWNPDLVPAAQHQSSACYFKHTPRNQYGENIAAGQQSIEQVLKEWVYGRGEKDSYVREDPSSTSHYTQVVWASSKELGCYIQTCDTMAGASLGPGPIKFYVCEYNPPGNVIGESPQEVHAATGGAPLSSGSYTKTRRHFSKQRRHT